MKSDDDSGPVLRWETLNTVREEDGVLDSRYLTERARIPGGWLVLSQFHIGGAHGLTFVPDPLLTPKVAKHD